MSLSKIQGICKRKASQNEGHSAVTRLDYRQSVSFTSFGVSKFELRTRPHVSGDFCIINFFYADTKISATRSVYESYTTVHTYRIRIRTSQKISQQSSRGKRLVLILWRQRIQKYTDTSIHPHVYEYTAYTEISTLESLYRNLRIHRAYTADKDLLIRVEFSGCSSYFNLICSSNFIVVFVFFV